MVLSSAELSALRRFKLKMQTKRFNISNFAEFMNNEIDDINYTESRRRASIIIKYELELDRMVCADKRGTRFRFRKIMLRLPQFVINKHNTVGTEFKKLYVIKRLKLATHQYKCHMCGYDPVYKQMRYYVNTPYGTTNVVMCYACNRVITEVQ